MSNSIYRVTEVIGTSTDRGRTPAPRGGDRGDDPTCLRVGEVVELDVTVEDGHVTHYRARVEHLVQVRSPTDGGRHESTRR